MLHAAALALLGFLALAQDKLDDKAREEEAKKKIADFMKDVAKAKPEDRPDLIHKLGEMQHPKILEELAKWLTKADRDTQKAAAREIGRYQKDQKAAETLVKVAKSHRDAEVIDEILDQVGTIRWRGVAKDLVVFFRNASLDISKSAVEAEGQLKAKDAIQPLLDLARELDAIRDDGQSGGTGGTGGTGGVGGPSVGPSSGTTSKADDDKVKRKKELLPAVLGALEAITGSKNPNVKEWQIWWNRNAKTFKEPDEEKKDDKK